MADESLAERVRSILARRRGVTQRRMFGGICFMLNGNMCCGTLHDELIVRVLPDEYDAAMKRPHVRAFDFTGRPMKGFVVVRAKGYGTDKALEGWIERGVKCARSRPAKTARQKPRRT